MFHWRKLLRRTQPRQLAGPGLEAASGRRFEGNWNTVAADPSLSNAVVRQRARYAVANDPYCNNGAAAWRDGLIGSGITPTSLVPDPAARETITDRWRRFVDIADIEGRTDLYGLQGISAHTLVIDGECLVYLVPGPELRLRIIPTDRLETSLSRSLSGGQIAAGVEFDSEGRRIAYHFRKDDMSLATVRVPASDICHVFRPDQPGLVRGISWFAPVLLTANELSQLLDAMLVGQKVSSMLMGFLYDQNNSGALPFEGTQTGSILQGGLEPATIKVLPQGWDIKLTSPQQVSTGIDLAKMNVRSIAAGLGLPDHLVSGDLSQANYSSLRAGLVQWKRRLEQVQFHVLAPQLLTPIWRRWLTLEVLSGRIDAPGFADDPESWLGVEWYPPPLDWVDPEKDAKAEVELIAAGLKSRRQAVAERGYSVETLDAEIAADREREATLGLQFEQPTNREVTRVLKHDDKGRILEFEKRSKRNA
jgi:lambda family phage portal protein